MKHGRRHNKLKEQAYLARKKAEGYGRPYSPLPVDEPTGEWSAEGDEPPTLTLGDAVNRRSKNALRRAGVKDR